VEKERERERGRGREGVGQHRQGPSGLDLLRLEKDGANENGRGWRRPEATRFLHPSNSIYRW
jgi:hypothetical protein